MTSSDPFWSQWFSRRAPSPSASASAPQPLSQSLSPTDAMPSVALVTGCPRSGTTAVLLWLGDQAGVHVRDESRLLVATHRFLDTVDRFTSLDDARGVVVSALRHMLIGQLRLAAPLSTRLLVEKEPLEPIALPDERYDVFVRHALDVLPALRIVFMLRHPVATVSSMRNRQWGHTLTSGEVRDVTVDEAIGTWRANAALAVALRATPAVHICRYEHLVANREQATHAIGAHLGLDPIKPFRPRQARANVLSDAEVQHVLASTVEERCWFDL